MPVILINSQTLNIYLNACLFILPKHYLLVTFVNRLNFGQNVYNKYLMILTLDNTMYSLNRNKIYIIHYSFTSDGSLTFFITPTTYR